MRLLLQPEHAAQAERHFDATRETLTHYGEWFGAYPYGHITIVDPAYQSDADGMEYPTLFTAGTRWLVAPRGLTPESVTIHEAGHQWWYGMVGSNEFEDAWMDEGLNTFSTARVEGVAYDPQLPRRCAISAGSSRMRSATSPFSARSIATGWACIARLPKSDVAVGAELHVLPVAHRRATPSPTARRRCG